MSKYESQFGESEVISVSEANGGESVNRSESALGSSPRIIAPEPGAEVGSRPTLQVNGHARHNVQIRDAHTLEPLSAVSRTNDFGDFNLVVDRNLPNGPNDIVVELWDGGDWATATKILRVNVNSSRESADINEDESELFAPGAGENPESRNDAMWGYTRAFFSNAYQGMRVEPRHTFTVGGHAGGWKWIEDGHSAEHVSEMRQTYGTGATNLLLLKDLKLGVNDLRVRMEGIGNWYMYSNALRVVVLPRPVITHSSISSTIRGQDGVPGADIELHRSGHGSFHGKGKVNGDGSWSINATGLYVGMNITCRQRFSTVKYVENTFSEWSYPTPVTA